MKINNQKTKYMCIGGPSSTVELENGEKISGCNKYNYLDVTINKDGKDTEDIRNRIKQGRIAMKKLNRVKNISKSTKLRIYDAIVKSITIYGAETWRMNESDRRGVEAVEMDVLRRSARKSRRDKVRNETIRNIIKVRETITQTIERRQLTWYGHVRRMADKRLHKTIWEWIPLRRRKQGRPRRTWGDNIKRALSERGLVEEQALNREEWRLNLEVGRTF